MTSTYTVCAAAVTMLLAGACSTGPDTVNREPASPPAATTTEPKSSLAQSPKASAELRLAVLGDSNAHPSSCNQCATFGEQVAEAIGTKFGSPVQVVNLAWELFNPNPAQVVDILEYVRTDDAARQWLRGADAVLIYVSQNDLAYNRIDDPCGVAPAYPRIRWDKLTHDCMDAALAEYEHDLEALLDEIDRLRRGRPTMLRIVTAINTAPGDLVDPTWNSPAAIEPSAYNVTRMAEVQCRLAARHDGKCADVLSVFNGPHGRESAQRHLYPTDATHLAQSGHDAVADVIVSLGFRPLASD